MANKKSKITITDIQKIPEDCKPTLKLLRSVLDDDSVLGINKRLDQVSQRWVIVITLRNGVDAIETLKSTLTPNIVNFEQVGSELTISFVSESAKNSEYCFEIVNSFLRNVSIEKSKGAAESKNTGDEKLSVNEFLQAKKSLPPKRKTAKRLDRERLALVTFGLLNNQIDTVQLAIQNGDYTKFEELEELQKQKQGLLKAFPSLTENNTQKNSRLDIGGLLPNNHNLTDETKGQKENKSDIKDAVLLNKDINRKNNEIKKIELAIEHGNFKKAKELKKLKKELQYLKEDLNDLVPEKTNEVLFDINELVFGTNNCDETTIKSLLDPLPSTETNSDCNINDTSAEDNFEMVNKPNTENKNNVGPNELDELDISNPSQEDIDAQERMLARYGKKKNTEKKGQEPDEDKSREADLEDLPLHLEQQNEALIARWMKTSSGNEKPSYANHLNLTKRKGSFSDEEVQKTNKKKDDKSKGALSRQK